MSHWFFLSYARDNYDEYLKRFYRDLNKTIRSLTAPGDGEDGFFDTKCIDVGNTWPEELVRALHSSRVFIGLYSPAYFAREMCGKEWQMFRRRLVTSGTGSQAQTSCPSLMMPVLWVPEARLPKPLPDAVSAVQYKHSDFGEVYAQEGLRQLMARSRFRDHYLEFLAKFADKLICAASYTLPPISPVTSIEEIESAFHSRVPESSKPAAADTAGPRFVQFVFVAGRREELRSVREKLDPYGEEGGYDWHPYLPEVRERVGLTSQVVACTEKLNSDIIQFDTDVLEQIDKAEQKNKIVAIVVDTWTLWLTRYSNPMRAYDGRLFLNCVVLVCWNSRDEELSREKRAELKALVEWIFHRNRISGNPNYFREVNSHDELVKELPILLNKAHKRISEKAKVMRKVENGRVIPKPLIM